jgi:hypothetical protein
MKFCCLQHHSCNRPQQSNLLLTVEVCKVMCTTQVEAVQPPIGRVAQEARQLQA